MRKLFYPKLAASNIIKNRKTYVPYIITCVITISMYYILRSLTMNEGINSMMGDASIFYMLTLGCRVIAIFAVIFLFYTNSFLMKRRKKEFGLFNILGMEKKHLGRVIALEALYIAAGSIVLGIAFGIILDKVMYMLLMKLMGYKVPLGFYISGKVMLTTIELFAAIFLLIFIYSLLQVQLAKPIELLKGGNVGEKEPKAKWLMAILGVLCLAGGYYIAVTTKNPIAAILLFFVAVILVIIGTYMLFTAGSIVLLKILRKNKRYYYKAKHFISISGMLYRMKQNAAGLATVCILSTMVLVMVSSTSSMMIGIESVLSERLPYDMTVYMNYDSSYEEGAEQSRKLRGAIENALDEKGIQARNQIGYTYLAFAGLRDKDTFLVDSSVNDMGTGDTCNLFFGTLDEYNAMTGADKMLAADEMMIVGNRKEYDYDEINLFDKTYQITEKLEEFPGNGVIASNGASSYYIVVKDSQVIEELYQLQKEAYDSEASSIRYCYGFDVDLNHDGQIELYGNLYDVAAENGVSASIESKADMGYSIKSMYVGFFFLGTYLGVLFVMATVLIIYYKQISEGYDDKERFEIMQKVGMSHEEVRRSIRSQILTVFFLPLIMAGIHIAFAFPIIKEILVVLNLTDTTLYIMCTIGCFAIFSAMYAVIYGLTAKAYYRIVKR